MVTKITSTSVRLDKNTPWYINTPEGSVNADLQNVIQITEQLSASRVISVEVTAPDEFTRINVTTIHDLPAYLAAFNAQELPAVNLPEISTYNAANNITVQVVTEEIP